jgi:hypothetical protein
MFDGSDVECGPDCECGGSGKWIQPLVSFPGKDVTSGKNLIEVKFVLPFEYVDDLWKLMALPSFRQHLDDSLSAVMAEYFDEIAETFDEIAESF